MSKLPKPIGQIANMPIYSASHVKSAYEQGRRDMLDEVLKIAPDSVKILIERLQEGK